MHQSIQNLLSKASLTLSKMKMGFCTKESITLNLFLLGSYQGKNKIY